MRTDLALAALASAAVPGMKPVSVAGIAPGDDGRDSELQTALVEDATGRRWVVRAPLTPVAGARLQRNDELVRQLSRHVPFKVPAAVGYAPLGKDGSAAVYPYVEGAPLDLRRLPAGPGLASAVGRAVAAIHNIPRGLFEEQDVPVFDAGGARQRAVAEVDRAAETGRVPTGLLARWEEAFEAAPLWQFATTPVHGAFTGGSVMVAFTDEEDAATGRVVAVTDWDEAMVGDPAVDLAELWSQTSRQAWEAVLESYTLARAHRPDPYLQARARLVAEMRSLRGLARAVAEDDEEAARRAVEVLRRVDRLTEADDSLVPVTARSAAPGGATGAAVPVHADGAQEAFSPPAEDDHDAAETWETETGDSGGHAGTVGSTDMAVGSAHGADGLDGSGGDADPSDVGGSGTAEADPFDVGAGGSSEEADLTMEVPRPAPHPGDAVLDDETELPGAGAEDQSLDEDATIQIDLAEDAAALVADPLAHDPVESPDEVAPSADLPMEDAVESPDEAATATPTEASAPRPSDEDVEDDDDADSDDDDADGDERPGEPEDLEDEERLHELYGMPSPERDADGR